MQRFGIDISRHQGEFDFKRAKADGVEFIILRGAYGTSKDSKVEVYYEICRKMDIPVGCYTYSIAKDRAGAVQEANFLLAHVLRGKQFAYPVYLDVEDQSQAALGKDRLTEIITAFCETLEQAGYYTGIYSTASFLRAYTHEEQLRRFDKWIAQWSEQCTYTGRYGMWQFGGETNKLRSPIIAGQVCDQDYAYLDYPSLIRNAGQNGFNAPEEPAPEVSAPAEASAEETPPEAAPAEKPVSVLAQEVLDGKWGNGAERKRLLTAAGYDYAEVQRAVNALVRSRDAAPARIYVVQAGDTLSKIARKYGTTVERILRENRGRYPRMTRNYIKVGWRLRV